MRKIGFVIFSALLVWVATVTWRHFSDPSSGADIGLGTAKPEQANQVLNEVGIESRHPESFPSNGQLLVTASQVCGEPHQPNAADSLFDENISAKRRLEVVQSLLDSTDAEHLFLGARMGYEYGSPEGLSAMDKALLANSQDVLINWNYLQMCAYRSDSCNYANAEKRAISVDGNNAALWASIAGYRYDRGDEKGALRALEKVSTVAEYREYWLAHIEAYERGFAVIGGWSYSERIENAIGVAASSAADYFMPLKFCRQRISSDSHWQNACLGYGARLASSEEQLLTSLVGHRIQQQVYEEIGNRQSAAKHQEVVDKFYAISNSDRRNTESAYLSNDEHILSDYMADWAANGERAARAQLWLDIERLEELPEIDACE